MHSEKRTKLRKPSNLLIQILFDSSMVAQVAEKGGYILTLNMEMFVWLMVSDKSIAQWSHFSVILNPCPSLWANPLSST